MRAGGVLALLVLTGCDDAARTEAEPTPLAPLAQRTVVLRHTPFDVRAVEKAIDRATLRRLSVSLLESTHLTDLPLTGGDAGGLVYAALAALEEREPADAAEANLSRLVRMTPLTTDLRGTALADLLDLAPALGLPASEILADTLGIAPEEPFLPRALLAEVLIRQVIATHPAVPESGALPVTLADVLSDLETLAPRFGPLGAHPGFLGPTRGALFGADLELVVRANVNAAPDKGLDLETVSVAGVNSIDDHPEALFDFDDPQWLQVRGQYRDPPAVDLLTFTLSEDARTFAGGRGPEPRPRGGSPVWSAAPWTLERVVAEAAWARWADFDHQARWPADSPDPLLVVTVEGGWLTLETPGDVGSPPASVYIWDLLLEVAQVRLHDDGVDRVEVALRLEDLPLGYTMDGLLDAVRTGLRADPSGLVAVAARLFDNTWGEADLFYRRPRGEEEDWLFFIAPEDLPPGSTRRYDRPGFYANAALTEPVHTRAVVDGDAHHLKLKIEPGMPPFHVQDEADRRYRITVLPKPGRARVALEVLRVQ